MRQSDATAHWASRLAKLAPASYVPGAALGIWAHGQETVFAAHGVLSTSTGVEVTPDSLFQIGSITKVWTGSMIMQLVDECRLSLDITVADVLPGLRVGAADVSAEVTVRHLLTHTSGIDGDLFTNTGRGDDCVARYVDELRKAAQTHPVGMAYSYCNSGFVLLGRIIEVLDGRVWDESLRQRLIEPLGLTQTVTLPEQAIMHRAAVGHRERPRSDEPVPTWMLARSLGPAGLITASVHDVLAFARMHLEGGVAGNGTCVLSAESAAAMRQPRFPIPDVGSEAGHVGLTWRLHHWNGGAVFGHDGGTLGQSAYLRIDPEHRVAVCLLTNSANGDPLYERLFAEVFREYSGIELPASPQPVPISSGGDAAGLDLARHVGTYERTSRRFDIAVHDGRLQAVITTTGELAALRESKPDCVDLYPADSSGDLFVCRSHDDEPWAAVRFGRLADGRPYVYSGGRVTLRSE
ncbi:MAG: serine hydrolase domain-containing protein [Streptosporangiaceae bacterium]